MKQRSRAAGAWDVLKTSFGFLPAVAMLVGIVAAIGLPLLDRELGIDVPALSFDGRDSARSVLTTIATATVSVAGLSFSVTVVAFTLASQQLSPRVLRSFRGDRLSQVTLAALLGTFVYCLVLLVRLGISPQSAEPPNLSMTVAVLASVGSFALFALFVAHIVEMLEPSSVVAAIHGDAKAILTRSVRDGPESQADAADAIASTRRRLGDPEPVRCREHGYVRAVDVEPIVDAAGETGSLVEQVVPVGSWALPQQTIAVVRLPAEAGTQDRDGLRDVVLGSFRLGKQRTMVEDVGFPIRQLADIALKALSPGINDPTTAQNAMEQLTTILVEFVQGERPSAVRCGAGGEPRLILELPSIGRLTRDGFEEVRFACGPHPRLSIRLLELLDHLRRCAAAEGLDTVEIERQRSLLAAGIGCDGPIDVEIAAYRARAGST